MQNILFSESESRRFNKRIYRASLDKLEMSALQEFYAENDPDITILRFPVAEQPKLFELGLLNKEVIFADTLIYYSLDLRSNTSGYCRNPNIALKSNNDADESAIEELVRKIFFNYTNHYYSNPRLEKEKITEGYAEWAAGLLAANDTLSVLAYLHDIPVGFIICKYINDVAEIILNGVLPDCQGLGLYTEMIRYVKNYFVQKNISSLKVSTQIQNLVVQKVWNREGFIMDSAYITIHLNKKSAHDPF